MLRCLGKIVDIGFSAVISSSTSSLVFATPTLCEYQCLRSNMVITNLFLDVSSSFLNHILHDTICRSVIKSVGFILNLIDVLLKSKILSACFPNNVMQSSIIFFFSNLIFWQALPLTPHHKPISSDIQTAAQLQIQLLEKCVHHWLWLRL